MRWWRCKPKPSPEPEDDKYARGGDAVAVVAMTALIVACGARGEEINAVRERIGPQMIPQDHQAVAQMIHDAIEAVRWY